MTNLFLRIRWRVLVISVLVCALPRCVQAQVTIENVVLLNQPLVRIEISGNKVTRPEIILREMESRPGHLTTRAKLRRDQLRVKSLNLFNRVEFHLTGSDQGPVLLIALTEKWYILPLPHLRFQDQDRHKSIYGLKYNQRNFRGRNETLSLDFWSGADHGFNLSHDNPWVKNTPQLKRSLELFQLTQTSQRTGVDGLEMRVTQMALGVGKRWTIQLVSDFGLRFRLVTGSDPRQLASGELIDRILETNVGSTWDARDLTTFPMEGYYLKGGFTNGWILNNSRRYQRLSFEVREYFPLQERISLAARLFWIPGWGFVPPYQWIYLSGNNPIRSTNLSDEGKNFYSVSIETRFELTNLHYFTWKGAPFYPQYFRNLEYGLGAEIFVEAGDAYNDSHEAGLAELKLGYGAGLLLRLPYVEVIRLEFSLNPRYSLKQISFGIKSGISF